MSTSPIADALRVFETDKDWTANLEARIARLEGGTLEPRMRELVYVVGYLVAQHTEAVRWHRDRAKAAGATDDDFRLMLRILDFYRGLRGFQDAQKMVSLWRTGNFPEVKPPSEGTVADVFAHVVKTRKYVANGFRVYSADGEWLRLYLQRSDAIKRAPTTLDERRVQLLSMAITLENHGYSNNWNDGCVQVHEDKARALGTTEAEILEVVQILEVCHSVTTAWQGAKCMGLEAA